MSCREAGQRPVPLPVLKLRAGCARPLVICQTQGRDDAADDGAGNVQPCADVAFGAGGWIGDDQRTHHVGTYRGQDVCATSGEPRSFSVDFRWKQVGRDRKGRTPDHVREESRACQHQQQQKRRDALTHRGQRQDKGQCAAKCQQDHGFAPAPQEGVADPTAQERTQRTSDEVDAGPGPHLQHFEMMDLRQILGRPSQHAPDNLLCEDVDENQRNEPACANDLPERNGTRLGLLFQLLWMAAFKIGDCDQSFGDFVFVRIPHILLRSPPAPFRPVEDKKQDQQ